MSQKNFACYIVTKEYLADRNNIFSSFYLWIFLTGGPCPNGWYNFKNHCYLVNSSVKTWHQAQEYCRSQEGDLVKITSAEENDFVLEIARKRPLRHKCGLDSSGMQTKRSSCGLTIHFQFTQIGLLTNPTAKLPSRVVTCGSK